MEVSLKRRIWRLVMMATPLPTLAKPQGSSFWQGHWKERQPDAELAGYAKPTDLKSIQNRYRSIPK